jgi:hypothetical protein
VNWSFIRREWGAVTFVLTVLLGIVIVPLALYFGNQSPAPPAPTPTASAPAASAGRTTTSPSLSPSPAPTP